MHACIYDLVDPEAVSGPFAFETAYTFVLIHADFYADLQLIYVVFALIYIEDAMRRDTAAPSFWSSAFRVPFAHVGFAI